MEDLTLWIPFTPHITGFSTGAGLKAFTENFGNFAAVFSFVVDILSIFESCGNAGSQKIEAVLIFWTLLNLILIGLLGLIFLVFSPVFFTMLIL